MKTRPPALHHCDAGGRPRRTKKLSEAAGGEGTESEESREALASLAHVVANEAFVLARHGEEAEARDLVVGGQGLEPRLGGRPDRLVGPRQLELQRDDVGARTRPFGELQERQTGLADVAGDRLTGTVRSEEHTSEL